MPVAMTPFTPNCRGAAVLAAAVFAAPAAQALDFSGSAALTSDYVFRGISQTQGNAAPQLGARLVLDSGFYGALWGSSVDYGDAAGSDAEVDLVAGWNRTFAGRWNLDVNLTRFTYPGTRAPLNLDYNEVIATLARAADIPAQASDNIERALAGVGALNLDPPPRVMITGSLYLAGAVLKVNGTPPT